MIILACDGSYAAASVVLYQDGAILFTKRHAAMYQQPGDLLALFQAAVTSAHITSNDVQYLAWTTGPGGFTRLRVVTGVLLGWAMVTQALLVPVCTLMSIAECAHRCYGTRCVIVLLRASTEEVYTAALYREQQSWQYECSPAVLHRSRVEKWARTLDAARGDWLYVGDVVEAFDLPGPVVCHRTTCAEDVATLAADRIRRGVDVFASDGDIPIAYLRDKIALTREEQ